MTHFTIELTEVHKKYVEIEADSLDEAISDAKTMYRNGELVIDGFDNLESFTILEFKEEIE